MINSSRSLPEQIRTLLQIYGIYRVLIALSLLIVYWLQGDDAVLGTRLPNIYILSTFAYSFFSLLTVRLYKQFSLHGTNILFAYFLVDSLFLMLILHASGSGGVTGISLLSVITVAAAAVTLGNPLALVIASLFVIGILADSLFSSTLSQVNTAAITNSGFFSIFLMLTALGLGRFYHQLINTHRRLQESQQVLNEVQHLNQLVVQNINTGIVVISLDRIVVHNQQAANVLELDTSNPYKVPIPRNLKQLYQQWQLTPERTLPSIMAFHEQQELRCQFVNASDDFYTYTIVFLDDAERATRQAQAMKLASLGRLTASIAHEIRNPLSAIKHAAQLIRETDLNEEDQKLLHIIDKQASRINQIIEDIRGFSKQQKIVVNQLDLSPFLSDFVDSFNNQYGQHLKYINHTDNASVNFEPSQLRQVLDNLCTNALRYSQPNEDGFSIILHLQKVKHTGRIALAVLDFGAPIAEDNVPRLFEPFFTTEHNGTGLGLYICREICLNNNASLDYRYGGRRRKSFSILFAAH